jgi:hypothetical protein
VVEAELVLHPLQQRQERRVAQASGTPSGSPAASAPRPRTPPGGPAARPPLPPTAIGSSPGAASSSGAPAFPPPSL